MIEQMQKTSTSELLLLHYNIRSLNKKIDQLQIFLNQVKSDCSVIGISETWINNLPSSFFSIPGYTFHSNNRLDRKGGGVGFFVTNNLKVKILKDLNIMCDSLECIFIEIELSKQKNIVVGEVYKPPSSNFRDFLDAFSDLLLTPSLYQKNIFIMGDFNLNLLHYSENVHCQEFLDLMLSKYLIPLIRKPTRVTDTSSTLIDNIFCNNISSVLSGVIVSDISDHFPIYAKAGGTAGLLMDLAANEKAVHADFFNDFDDLFDDEDLS
ncbi:uncharacterized protein [Diadema setosum]|uniref:uncharacterized protein n=1 Tax=Diadema setosum TaxID=31175 RepID=UPI003B3B0B0C